MDFSLDKDKRLKMRKKRQNHMVYPGGDVIHRGPNWTVSKIEDQGDLGRDALVSMVVI